MQIYYIYSKYANKIQLIFKKKYCTRQKSTHARNHLHTHAPTCQPANGSGTGAGLRRPPSRPDATREARRGGRHSFAAHLDTQAPTHQPTRTAPRTPYPHISSPGGPRADRRPRSVAAGFPRERHFPRAVHRLKISELILFSYRVNILEKNI